MSIVAAHTTTRHLLERSRTPPAAGGFAAALVLSLSMALATTWAVLEGGWTDHGGGTLLVAVTAVAEAALLARGAIPRVLTALATPLLAFAAVVPFTAATMVPDGDGGLRHFVGRYVMAMFFPRSLWSPDDWMFLVGVATAIWCCAYFLTWMAVAERRGAAAVFPCFFVLVVNVMYAPVTGSLFWPDAIAAVFAILVIAQSSLGELSVSWRRRGIPALPGTVSRYSRSGLVAITVVMAIALLAPPATSHDYSAALTNGLRGSGQGGHGAANGGSTSGAVSVGFSASAVPGGALSDASPQPMLRYTSSTSAPVYLSVAVDTQFGNGEWLPAYVSVVDMANGGTLPRDTVDVGAARQNVSLDVTSLNSQATVAAIPQFGTNATAALAPWAGDMTTVGTGGTAEGYPGHDAGRTLATVERYRFASNTFAAGATLQVTGSVSTATVAQLQAAGTDYPNAITGDAGLAAGFVDDRNGDITRIARQWTSGATNPYDMAAAIEAHLRDPAVFHYSLSPPQSSDSSVWPIVYFLTTSHSGYCQYYASSMAALLRAAGVPARVVNGYGPGRVSGTAADGRPQFEVTSNDAHTWVEVYFPHYGWVPFEPTPSSVLGVYDPIPRGALPTPGPTPGTTSTPAPSATSRPAPSASAVPLPGVTPGPAGPPPALVGTATALLAAFAGGAAGILWLLNPGDALALWRRVTLLGRLLGVRRRAGDTDAEFVERIIASLPADTVTLLHPGGGVNPGPRPLRAPLTLALRDIAALSGKERFAAGGMSGKERVLRLHNWRRVVRLTPALAWRAVLAHRRLGPRSQVADTTIL